MKEPREAEPFSQYPPNWRNADKPLPEQSRDPMMREWVADEYMPMVRPGANLNEREAAAHRHAAKRASERGDTTRAVHHAQAADLLDRLERNLG